MRVTFVDANPGLVNELNTKKEYRILIKRNKRADEEIMVKNFEAVHSSETNKIIKCLNDSDVCATSVGQGALSKVIPLIGESIKIRTQNSIPPLDIIIAENIRNGANYFRKILKGNNFPENEAGLIETSIGKMVPIMTDVDLADDPLVLHAEEYNTLILDRKGFRNMVPDFSEIKAVENIAAWVDRKLFIHNLGHAASAYLGFVKYPKKKLIAEILEDTEIKNQVHRVMAEASEALLKEYPSDFTSEGLNAHIDDLLFRFQNKALGDTVFRVGRDLPRKLGRDDRILGSIRLCLKHNTPFGEMLKVFYSALNFAASDQAGEIFKPDENFIRDFTESGTKNGLTDLCGLDFDKDSELIDAIL